MLYVIEELAQEGSTYYPTITFYDEDKTAMTPDTLKWKLTDVAGNVVNSRTEVTVSSLSTSTTLTLTGDDLAVIGNDIAGRIITLWGTYTSITYGAGKAFLFQVKFNVQPKVGKVV